MSNPLAIAAVTATFGQLLGRVTEEPTLSGAGVSMRPLDQARTASQTNRQLNLFLYQVRPNAAWRNMDLPFRDSNADLTRRPMLALGLYYLVTAYGQDNDDLDAQHLLAHAMSLVHDQAVLTRDQIRAAITSEPAIAQSDLADQIELVKLCPTEPTLEDIFKLWTTFQTQYRLSVSYEASVVLIERPSAARATLPVRAANLYVMPFRQPVIESVSPQVLPPGGQLTIQGRNLTGDVVKVRFGSVTADPDTITDRQITLNAPATLSAGVNTVQVVHQLNLGTPATPHRGFESNVAAFILAPRITTPQPISVARGASLSLSFQPAVHRAQQVAILVGDQQILLPARPVGAPPATTLGFPIPSTFPTGDFLLRLRVDGAESPLDVDTDPASPTFNQYTGPEVTIT
ncbi:MAG TPA: DUF4255 domain-containing protein [Chloroflexia bacterium]|jgi:hypothetical protein